MVVNMRYREENVTRWHDIDAHRHVRPSFLLTYMQELACHQMEAAGQGLDALRDTEGLAFILTRMVMVFDGKLGPLEKYTAQTWISPARGLFYPRSFVIERPDGTPVARAFSHWVLMDLRTGHPVRPADFSFRVKPEEALDLTFPRRIRLPEGLREVGTRRIAYSDIDYNGHMNNTHYPDMLCDFLPTGAADHLRTMDLDFCRGALYGSTLSVLRSEEAAEEGKAYGFQTLDADGQVCLCARVTTDGGEDAECSPI